MTRGTDTNAIAARRYLRARSSGMLATVSKKLGGYPFGSVVAYATDHAARPVVLVSTLAEHTRNLEADPRCSLLVSGGGDDPQAAARLTVIGDAERFTPDADLGLRLTALLPGAAQLHALGDFGYFRIAPRTLRYIEGFGGIHWVAAAAYAPPEHRIAEAEREIVAHMNDDHADALIGYARQTGLPAGHVRMLAIDCDGIDLEADGARLRIDFDAPVTNVGAARTALVALARGERTTPGIPDDGTSGDG